MNDHGLTPCTCSQCINDRLEIAAEIRAQVWREAADELERFFLTGDDAGPLTRANAVILAEEFRKRTTPTQDDGGDRG